MLWKNTCIVTVVNIDGWNMHVVFSTFPDGKSAVKSKKGLRKSKLYTYVGKGNNKFGSGCSQNVIEKYACYTKLGVYMIQYEKLNREVSDCCFVVAVLVALAHYNCTKLFCSLEIGVKFFFFFMLMCWMFIHRLGFSSCL